MILQEIKKLLKSHDDQRKREQKISNIKNSKYFFAYVNKIYKNISVAGPLENNEGILVGEPENMANILKKHNEGFQST